MQYTGLLIQSTSYNNMDVKILYKYSLTLDMKSPFTDIEIQTLAVCFFPSQSPQVYYFERHSVAAHYLPCVNNASHQNEVPTIM